MSRTFLEQEELEAAGFQERLERRRAGKHKPKPIKKGQLKSPRVKRILVLGDSHAHPDETNERFEWLGRMIVSKQPDIVLDIGDSADLPSLMNFDKPRPTPVFEGFNALWRDVESYYDAQDRLMNIIARGKVKPKFLKTQGNHEYRLNKVLQYEPRLRGFVGPEILREREYGWAVTPYGKILSAGGAHFSHLLPGGSSKMGPRGVISSKPGTAGVYCYGHTHRRGVYYYTGLKPNHGAVINVGCYFRGEAKSHVWAGDDRLTWQRGIQEITVDGHGRLRSEVWTDYEEVRRLWG